MKKRIILIGLAAVTAFSLAACGGKKEPQIKTVESITYYTEVSGYRGIESGDIAAKTISEYDKEGNVIYREETNPSRAETYEYVWKESNGILKGTCSDGSWEEIERDKNDNPLVTRSFDAEGELFETEECEYKDGVLCKRKITQSHTGFVSTIEYDEKGNITYQVSINDKQKTVEREYDNVYDEDGKLTSVFVNDILNCIDWVDTYEYDEEGQLKRVTEGYSNITANGEYDEDGNMIKQSIYDSEGRLEQEVIYTYY